jgi:hypothetical protein
MRLVERTILSMLFAEAAKDGFFCERFACTPATGEPDDEIVLSVEPGLTAPQCVQHADQWDSHSIAEFTDGENQFWVLIVWGNREDILSDYSATDAANTIMKRVYHAIEGNEEN